MPNKMTPEQMADVLFVFKSGIACGLNNFEDCILNWQNHVGQLYRYSEIAQKEKEMYTSLCEFYKGTAGYPEEEEDLAKLTPETTPKFIADRIAAQRRLYEQDSQR